jgi:hypothetical protein
MEKIIRDKKKYLTTQVQNVIFATTQGIYNI